MKDHKSSGSPPSRNFITPALVDNHGREITYLRLAVTPYCNLRCRYCMPDGPTNFPAKAEQLNLSEMKRVVNIFAQMGVSKLRLTGGEPLIWQHTPDLMQYAYDQPGIKSVHLTTNGVHLGELIPKLVHPKFAGVNISLDSLQTEKYKQITQRPMFGKVRESIDLAVDAGLKVKLNVVVQHGINDDEIISFTELAKTNPIDVRFIEEMPFNGSKVVSRPTSRIDIMSVLNNAYPTFIDSSQRENTSVNTRPPGFMGKVGIIDGLSRSFCSSCNRVRVTSTGELKSCLYKKGEINLKLLFETGFSDHEIKTEINALFQHRSLDGHLSELSRNGDSNTSMSLIGG
mgnify:CR=1 FL=1